MVSMKVASRAATVEEILGSSRGNCMFPTLMASAVGMAIFAIGTQVTLLGYLVPCVAADWDLSSTQEGTLTASLFVGELAGSLMLGVVSDLYGRRTSARLAMGLVAVFGLLTAAAPSFWWLLVCRAMVGLGVGGGQVAFHLLGEVVPQEDKSRILVDIQTLWPLASIFVGLVSWVVLSLGFSWRWIAFFTDMPALVAICCFIFIIESPRWLLVSGREREAKQVLRQIAKRNKVVLEDFTILPEEMLPRHHRPMPNGRNEAAEDEPEARSLL